ncbi:MAG: DUF928 domain-containing protein [Cyanobacteria bacterium P01_D01_bin.156]
MRYQNRLTFVSFVLAVLISHLGLTAGVSAIPNPIDNGGRDQRTASLPDAPSTPPPTGERTPGGGLGEDVCPETPHDLTAITPVTVYGKTLSERPTFWFYMPYTAAEVQKGEFSVLTSNDEDWLYRAEFVLPEQPGLVSITLPPDAIANLEVGERHHWYLKLFCNSTSTAKTNININGWVDRVAATPEMQRQVMDSSPEVWYDTIARLADRMKAQRAPGAVKTADCIAIEQKWGELLESVDLAEFIQTPVLGPVELVEN